MQTQDQSTIATFNTLPQAVAALRKLQAAGLQAEVAEVGADPESTTLTTSANTFLVRVDVDQMDLARQTLTLRVPSVLRPGEWLCSACGEIGDPGFGRCWSCGIDRSGAVDDVMPEPPQSGCGSGCGCGPSGSSGGRILSIEFPAEWDQTIQKHDQIAHRALQVAAIGAVLPPVLLYACVLLGKSLLIPLSPTGSNRFYAAFAVTVTASIGWVMVLNHIL